MGNVDVVVMPAGRAPIVIVGVADVPVAVAVTVTKKESLAEMMSGDGLIERDKVSIGGGGAVELPPVPPAPQPFKMAAMKKTSQSGSANFGFCSKPIKSLLKKGLLKR
jgi:hypothetical protein